MIRNPSRKALLVTVLFGMFGLAGVMTGSSPVIPSFGILYVLLLCHTYLSVRCFSALTDPKDLSQNVIDLALVVAYLGLALSMNNASFWIWWIALFLFAVIKYALMVGGVHQPKLLRRKLLADAGGALFGLFYLSFPSLADTLLHLDLSYLYTTPILNLSLFEWTSVLVFGGASVYYFFLRPLYVHDKV